MRRKRTTDALFAVAEVHFYAVAGVEVEGEVLGTVDAAMLPARAAEGEHEVGEAALKVALYVLVGEGIDAGEETGNLTVVFKKLDDGGIETREVLIGLVAPGVVGGTAVENVAATVAGGVGGNAALIAETEDTNY